MTPEKHNCVRFQTRLVFDRSSFDLKRFRRKISVNADNSEIFGFLASIDSQQHAHVFVNFLDERAEISIDLHRGELPKEHESDLTSKVKLDELLSSFAACLKQNKVLTEIIGQYEFGESFTPMAILGYPVEIPGLSKLVVVSGQEFTVGKSPSPTKVVVLKAPPGTVVLIIDSKRLAKTAIGPERLVPRYGKTAGMFLTEDHV